MEKWIVLTLMAAFVITFIAIWIPLLRKADADMQIAAKKNTRDSGTGMGLSLSGGTVSGGGGAAGGDGGGC